MSLPCGYCGGEPVTDGQIAVLSKLYSASGMRAVFDFWRRHKSGPFPDSHSPY
jgi:hypothetical protein